MTVLLNDVETKVTRAEAEVTRLTEIVNAADNDVTCHLEMEGCRGKAKGCKQKTYRSHHITTSITTISTKQFTYSLTHIRTPTKRSRDYPEHVGGIRPLNGIQICQKITTESGMVLKKVKLERDGARSDRDETK